MDSLKAMSAGPIESKSTPSPIQVFLGAIAAGVIALILYKFTTTIEAALNRQTMSDNFSVCTHGYFIFIYVFTISFMRLWEDHLFSFASSKKLIVI